jgi:hypothetical protein
MRGKGSRVLAGLIPGPRLDHGTTVSPDPSGHDELPQSLLRWVKAELTTRPHKSVTVRPRARAIWESGQVDPRGSGQARTDGAVDRGRLHGPRGMTLEMGRERESAQDVGMVSLFFFFYSYFPISIRFKFKQSSNLHTKKISNMNARYMY